MKKGEIKNIITEALYYEDNNNSLDAIKAKCNLINQVDNVVIAPAKYKKSLKVLKPILLSTAAACLAVGAFYLGTLDYSFIYRDKASSIYLDVNPSVEIKVNKNKVIETKANNEDGENILSNIHLKGVDVKTALYAVIGSMYTLGYIDTDTNSILVSVENRSSESSILLDDITSQIVDIFKDNDNMDASVIAQNVKGDKELKDLAEKYGISIGKMELILKIIEKSELYTEEDIEELSKLSIKELNLIYKSLFEPNEGDNDVVVEGEPNGFIDEDTAIQYVLDYLSITEDDLESIEAEALFHKHREEHEEKGLMYLVTLKYLDGETIERYIVDCSTGEILSHEDIEDWKDKIPNDGGHFGGPDKDDDRPSRPEGDVDHPDGPGEDKDHPERPEGDDPHGPNGDKPPHEGEGNEPIIPHDEDEEEVPLTEEEGE